MSDKSDDNYEEQDLIASFWDFDGNDDRPLWVMYNPAKDCIWLDSREFGKSNDSILIGEL